MHNGSQSRHRNAATRCAICDGKFGLVRHYSWRTALCSSKCVDRLKYRKESDRGWLLRLHTVRQGAAVGMIGFRSEEAVR